MEPEGAVYVEQTTNLFERDLNAGIDGDGDIGLMGKPGSGQGGTKLTAEQVGWRQQRTHQSSRFWAAPGRSYRERGAA